MLNQTGVYKESYGNRKTILVDELNSTAFSVVVDATGVSADTEGKKIIKAGTPVTGDLTDRDSAFVVASTTEGVSNAVGVILHDVDVTGLGEGETRNSQVVVFGFIDISKLETSVQSLITSEVQTALRMIQFVK